MFQVDKTLAYAMMTRVWQVFSGPITIALVISSLTGDQTGIYYGLSAVIGIQGLFELGLLNVLIGHAGHAAAGMMAADASGDRSTLASRAAMRHLIDASRRWFALVSVIFAVSALGVGWFTFSNSDTQAAWLAPLLVVVPVAAVTVYLSPSLAILEGSGDRELIYRAGFQMRVMGSVVVWISLYFGGGAWALVLSALVQALWSMYLRLVYRADFFRRFRQVELTATDFRWSKDVAPAQWRAAAHGVAHHLAMQYFTIILLNFWSSEDAGRLGLTLTITTSIQMLALAWAQTKFSVISALHGKGQREQAGNLWRHTALVSTAVLVVAFVSLTILIYFLPELQRVLEGWGAKRRDLASRFITPMQCAVLGIACLSNHFVALQGFYVLARKANPLTRASVPGFLSIALTVWVAGYFFATNGIVIGFAVSMTLIAFPLHTIAYLRFRSGAVGTTS